jgi:hypothetical protein
VISTKLVGGKTVVHVFSETQPEGFEPVPASLEDVYFSTLHTPNRPRSPRRQRSETLLRAITSFELKYHLKAPLFYILFIVYFC